MPIFTAHHEDRWLQGRLLCGDAFAVYAIILAITGHLAPVAFWFAVTWFTIALCGKLYSKLYTRVAP